MGKFYVTWTLLCPLSNQINFVWCCVGDFSEVLGCHEKEGVAIRPRAQIVAFQDALRDCALFDIDWNGTVFTWVNGYRDATWTRLRLARVVVTTAWQAIFSESTCFTLFATVSDRMPILLDLDRIPRLVLVSINMLVKIASDLKGLG